MEMVTWNHDGYFIRHGHNYRQTKRFWGKFAKHGNKKNNSFRNIISYNSANAGEMSGPEMSVTDIMRNVYIDCINNVNVKS